METGGVRCSRFLPGFGSFLDPPASDIGGVPPIGTALVAEFCSASHPRDHDSFMAVVGVALGAAWPASLPRDSCRFMARARETDPPAPPVRRAEPIRSPSRHVARRQTGPVCATGFQKESEAGQEREQRTPPCFQRVPPCFLSVICFWRNYLRSLIPLRDCPLRASIASLFFLENLPVSGEKTASDPGFELEAIDGDTSDHEAHEKVDAGASLGAGAHLCVSLVFAVAALPAAPP